MDLSTIGKKTATLTVASVTEDGNFVNVTFEELDGSRISTFKDKKFGTPLEKGAKAEAVIEVKPAKSGNGLFICLDSFGGAPAKGFGGGGGRQFQPKTPAEIHGSNIAGIIKSCIESCESPEAADAFAIWGVKTYKAAIKSVCGEAA